jgi:hypothetical protein
MKISELAAEPLPYDGHAEWMVLAAMLKDCDAAIYALTELVDEDFYIERHRTLFTVLSCMLGRPEAVAASWYATRLQRQALMMEWAINPFELQGDTGLRLAKQKCKIVRDLSIQRELMIGINLVLAYPYSACPYGAPDPDGDAVAQLHETKDEFEDGPMGLLPLAIFLGVLGMCIVVAVVWYSRASL